MIRAFLILLLVASSAQSIVWDEGFFGELHWKEQLSLENYTLALADFSFEDREKVLVELQGDNHTIACRVLHAGESSIINDSVKVSAMKIRDAEMEDEPYAVIRLQLPAIPEISLIISSDKDVYRGGEDIRMKLSVENQGAVDAENLRIKVDSASPLINEMISIPSLSAGSVWDEKEKTAEDDPIKIDLMAPYLPLANDLEVRVHGMYTDTDGDVFQSWGGAKVHISGPLQLHKRVEETQEFSKSYYVINSLSNWGNRNLSIDLADSTGKGFQTNDTLTWKIVLEPGKTKTVSYRVKAIEPGMGQSLPDAIASYSFEGRIYAVHSNKPVIDVIGPLVDVKRSISPKKVKLGEEVTISLGLENRGNRKAMLFLEETIPEGAELTSGLVNESLMLSSGEKTSREIRLRILDPDGINIPASVVRYRDVRGNEYNTGTSALRALVQEERLSDPSDNNLNETGTDGASENIDVRADEKPDVQKSDDGKAENRSWAKQNLLILFIVIILLLSSALGLRS